MNESKIGLGQIGQYSRHLADLMWKPVDSEPDNHKNKLVRLMAARLA